MSAYVQVRGVSKRPDGAIGAVLNEGAVLVRHKFFSAVLGKPVQGVDASKPGPVYVTDFEPRQEGFHAMSGVALRQVLLDSLGPVRAATARFSTIQIRAGRGSFYGVVLDAVRYIAVNVTDPAGRRSYEFFWDGPDGLKQVKIVTKIEEKGRSGDAGRGPYHLIPVAEAGSADRLLVFRRGQREAAVAGLWPMADWLKKMEPQVEADPKALADAGIGMDSVRRAAAADRWLDYCARFLEAYPSFQVKTYPDEWKRGECVKAVERLRQ